MTILRQDYPADTWTWPGMRSRRAALRDASFQHWYSAETGMKKFTVRYVNAGQGAREGGMVHDMACKAGLPSVNGNTTCNLSALQRAAHTSMLGVYELLSRDLQGHKRGDRTNSTSPDKYPATIVRYLLTRLHTVLTSGIVALHGGPYTQLLDEIVTAIPHVRVLLPWSHPVSWAARRGSEPLGGEGLLCRAPVVETRGEASYFDLVACLTAAHEQGLSTEEALDTTESLYASPGGKLQLAARFAAHTAYVLSSIRRRTAFTAVCLKDGEAADGSLDEVRKILTTTDELYYHPAMAPRLLNWRKRSTKEVAAMAKAGCIARPTPSLLNRYGEELAVLPRTLVKMLARLARPYEKREFDFLFIGALGPVETMELRQWILPFAKSHFTNRSYLDFTDTDTRKKWKSLGTFDHTIEREGFYPKAYKKSKRYVTDQSYYELMGNAVYAACPAGDASYSMRFYEALASKTIPIVNTYFESFRTFQEARLDYKFYLVEDAPYTYRQDWVDRNYETFLRYHTLTGHLAMDAEDGFGSPTNNSLPAITLGLC